MKKLFMFKNNLHFSNKSVFYEVLLIAEIIILWNNKLWLMQLDFSKDRSYCTICKKMDKPSAWNKTRTHCLKCNTHHPSTAACPSSPSKPPKAQNNPIISSHQINKSTLSSHKISDFWGFEANKRLAKRQMIDDHSSLIPAEITTTVNENLPFDHPSKWFHAESGG